MYLDQQPGFGPQSMKQLFVAFDAAWDTLKDTTNAADRESVREAIGKAIIGLAKTGYRDTGHLANYGVYQGRSFIDRQVTQLSFAADHLPGWPTLGLVTLNGVNDALELGGLVRSLRAAAQRVSPKHEKRMHCVCFLQHGCRCRIFGRGRGMSLARLEAVACGFQVLHGGYALAINLTHGI